MHVQGIKFQKFGTRVLDLIVGIRTSRIRRLIPRPLKRLFYHMLPKQDFELKTWEAEYRRKINSVKAVPLTAPITLGIIKDSMFRYGNFEAACLELGVPYKLIDISGDSWILEVKDSGCNAFLVWPSCYDSRNKQMFDERLHTIVDDLKKNIFPSYESLWLYESKIRTADWLAQNDIPHPKTHVFFDKDQVVKFLDSAQFPLMFKTDLGSTATGVELVRDQKRAIELVNICFGKGFYRKGCVWNDKCHGHIIFQEYIPDVKEWRMVRIGDSYFGHQKLKKGDFHSGSKLFGWDTPPRELLDFCRAITDKGSFLSMNIDVFETPEHKYLVNELQAVFGQAHPHQMYMDGKPGRFVYDQKNDSWHFEEGDFCRNILCNLRVKTFLKLLGVPLVKI